MTLAALDLRITQWVNSAAGHAATLDAVFVFLATGLIVCIAIAAVVVLSARASTQRALLAAEMLGTLVIAIVVGQIIGAAAFRERPFVRHQVQQLIAKDAREKSFPSDHATAAFALAIPAAVAARRRWVAVVLLGSAAAVAIGRVFVGVHYVSDVFAGSLLAWTVWWFVHHAMKKNVRRFSGDAST